MLVAAVACLTPVTTGATGRFLSEVLTGDVYVLGRSLHYLVVVGAQLVGMAVGGVLIVWLGPEWTVLVTAGGHLLAALISRLFLPYTEVVGADGSIVRKTLRGNAALVATPELIKLIMVQCLPAGYLAAAGSLVIPYAGQRAFSPAETGPVLAAISVGMLIGDLVIGPVCTPATRERLVLPLLLVMGAPSIALVLDPPYPAVLAVYVITGIGPRRTFGCHRWVIERSPARLTGYRRLTTRYERTAHHVAAFLTLAAALTCYKKHTT
ncbi:transposase [Actinopolyspora xinjiangensis]|uniref:transposase n=1 Tax=Actinopolyspora xinjiangensis TaxID=405564 RepID=UPI00111356DB|nr:transposase [Actinopolyspora xinjiangensis]